MLGDGGVAFDTSAGWRRSGRELLPETDPKKGLVDSTGATTAEAAVAQSAFRFFDGDISRGETVI